MYFSMKLHVYLHTRRNLLKLDYAKWNNNYISHIFQNMCKHEPQNTEHQYKQKTCSVSGPTYKMCRKNIYP